MNGRWYAKMTSPLLIMASTSAAMRRIQVAHDPRTFRFTVSRLYTETVKRTEIPTELLC